MSRLILCILACVLFCNCSPMKLQKPIIEVKELPNGCSDLFNTINTNWKKHKCKKCHEGNPAIFDLCYNNKECLKQLSKAQVIQLFGQPDVVDSETHIGYIIKENCKEGPMLFYRLLDFSFKEDGNQVEILMVDSTQ